MTERALRMVYREIPAMSCIPGCTACCGPAPFTRVEIEAVVGAIPPGAEIVPAGDGFAVVSPLTPMRCAFASDRGCAIYDNRPTVCRLFGTAPADKLLACPKGCRPKHALGPTAARRLMARAKTADLAP
jgi:Fe-S-cluster containining protein